MLKEIHEQPKAVRDTLAPRLQDGRVVLDDITLTAGYLQNLSRIYVVACGSAYYVGVQGKYIIEKLCQIPVEPVLASEFRYADPVLGDVYKRQAFCALPPRGAARPKSATVKRRCGSVHRTGRCWGKSCGISGEAPCIC